MPDKKKVRMCMYKCNLGIRCEGAKCENCEHNPEISKKRKFHASGMSLIDGKWQSCGWTIEATSFSEAARVAESDGTFRLHSLSDGVMY